MGTVRAKPEAGSGNAAAPRTVFRSSLADEPDDRPGRESSPNQQKTGIFPEEFTEPIQKPGEKQWKLK